MCENKAHVNDLDPIKHNIWQSGQSFPSVQTFSKAISSISTLQIYSTGPTEGWLISIKYLGSSGNHRYQWMLHLSETDLEALVRPCLVNMFNPGPGKSMKSEDGQKGDQHQGMSLSNRAKHIETTQQK